MHSTPSTWSAAMADYAIYGLLDDEFFLSLDRRVPAPEFRERAAAILGADTWEIEPRGIWAFARPRGWTGLRQGWKLHLSATPANAAEVLEKAAGVLRDDPAAFKFAGDRTLVRVMTSKNWPRAGAGKFITVYPESEEQFRRLAGALAAAAAGLKGQYILSDRRVPGSHVVFYRYGEHQGFQSVTPQGHTVHHLLAPSGEAVADGRRGYYQLPEWVEDPYGASPVRVLESKVEKVTLHERYRIERCIKHSNVGGVYEATDLQSGRPVVVRERRPFTGWTDDATDAVALLHDEARLLRLMDGSGFTPDFVDQFQEWEHHYLVMEKVEGLLLRDFALSRYFRRRSMASPRRVFWTFRRVILALLRVIEEFHRRGIVIRDLSMGNVLVRPDRTPCLIDFEFAWDRSGSRAYAARINTAGFASPAQMAGETPTDADDFHALGAIIVEMCAFLAPGLRLNRGGMLAMAELAMAEIGLPPVLLDSARGLMEPDPARRWSADAVRKALNGVRASTIPWGVREPGRGLLPAAHPAPRVMAASACERLTEFFEAAANPGDDDHLWPGSPEGYQTNHVCIRYGACGPIEYVRRARGACPDAWLDWVERRAFSRSFPPGLYIGQAGVALTLAACGRHEVARSLVYEAVRADAELPPGLASLFNGRAGVGVAALALGDLLGDAGLQGEAVRIGDELEAHTRRRRHGIAWPGDRKVVPCGLADGASGAALFYTYLGAVTGREHYWEVARQALEFEFSQVTWNGGYAFWPMVKAGRHKMLRSPHVSFGSAGVATAAARLYACIRDPGLRPWIDACADTLTLRWTNKLWQDMGMAGYGETLLDLYAATGDPAHIVHAHRLVEALQHAQVKTRFGTAFPGMGLDRVTSDFGGGASGIALFLHRLVHGGHRAFFPDHLLPGWPAHAPASVPAAAAAEPALSAAPATGTSGAAAAPRRAGRAPARARARTPA
jgi:tRNA A-37 threonylcarbamoyl transferase component Bud32